MGTNRDTVARVFRLSPWKAALLGGAISLLANQSPASAATITWDFGAISVACGNQALPGGAGCVPAGSSATTNSYSLQMGGYTLTAYGFNQASTGTSLSPHDLYWKGNNITAGSEHGLGLVGTNDNELTLSDLNTIANFVQIDVGSIYLAFINPQIRIQSVQLNAGADQERWDIFGSNVLGSIGTRLTPVSGSSADNIFVGVPNWGTYRYYSIAVHTPAGSAIDDVLFDSIRADTAPEPSGWMLAAGGMGLVLLGNRKRLRKRG